MNLCPPAHPLGLPRQHCCLAAAPVSTLLRHVMHASCLANALSPPPTNLHSVLFTNTPQLLTPYPYNAASAVCVPNAWHARCLLRRVMSTYGLTEDQAITAITVGVDFGITQVVDGNWGVHAIVPKYMFENLGSTVPYASKVMPGTSLPAKVKPSPKWKKITG